MTHRSLSTLLILLACAGPALADDAAASAAPAPRLKLEGSQRGVALAPKGNRVLWFERHEGRYRFFFSDTQGIAPQEVVRVDARSPGQLEHVLNGGLRQWAPDSSRFGFATVERGVLRAGIAQLDGTTELFDDTEPRAAVETHSLCFAPEGGGGWYVEGRSAGIAPKSTIHTFDADGERGEPVFEVQQALVTALEPSPDGARLAFFLGTKQGRRVAILDLTSGVHVTSGVVRVIDHLGRPRLFWTADSEAVVFTARSGPGVWPASVLRFDATGAELRALVSSETWAVFGVSAQGEVSLVDPHGRAAALLNPTTGERRAAPGNLAIGQESPRSALLYEPESGQLWLE
ncbi:MAG: hypothetical protein R3F62_09760 [Planctomycetota bacterium]